MWDLPRPGLEPVSPALAGRFSTTAPPGKPLYLFNIVIRRLLTCGFAPYCRIYHFVFHMRFDIGWIADMENHEEEEIFNFIYLVEGKVRWVGNFTYSALFLCKMNIYKQVQQHAFCFSDYFSPLLRYTCNKLHIFKQFVKFWHRNNLMKPSLLSR